MNERKAKEVVRACLEKEGFIVSELQPSHGKTPDFIFMDDSDTYVLELKQKKPSPREGKKFRIDEETGWGIYVTADSTGRRNRFSGIISNAVAQLNAADTSSDPLKLLWFFGEGPDAGVHEEQLVATIYGAKDIIWFAEGQSECTMVKCLYADCAEFETYKADLDGVIASDNKGLLLYLNNRSPRYERLRDSGLARVLGAAVYDPIAHESSHQVLLLDRFDRVPSVEDVKATIARKYRGEIVAVINFDRHYAEVYVPGE
jgi:hypothetical protein